MMCRLFSSKRSITPGEGGPTFPLSHRLRRAIWKTVWFLCCSWTPPFLWRWRRFILVLFGAKIGKPCDVRRSARIWYPANLKMDDWSMLADEVICYNVAPIEIGSGTIISQRAHLCTASHDIDHEDFPLIARKIIVGKMCWVASEAFVGPGVKIGDGAVLGARAAAFKDLQPWGIYRGNPAGLIRIRQCVQPIARPLRTAKNS